MTKRQYSQEFKLSVVREYLQSIHGIRVVARSFGLPSKNYITRWVEEMLKIGQITEEELVAAGKKSCRNKGKKQHPYEVRSATPREKQLEKENLQLRAELDLTKKVQQLERRDHKKE